MAVSDEQLSVEVVLDSKGAIKGIKDLEGKFVDLSQVLEKSSTGLTKTSGAINEVGKSASQSSKKTDGFASQLKGSFSSILIPVTALNQGFQLVEATIGKLVSTFSGFVTAFAEAEKSQVSLEKTLGMLGDRVTGTASQWGSYLDALQETTGANGDQLRSQVAMALKIGLSEQQTKNLTEASIKLAAVSGEDVNSSFQSLLSTYKGVGKAVAIYASDVNKLTQEQFESGGAIDLINKKYKDVESTFKTTLSGAIEGAKNQFGELSESLGATIATTLNLESNFRSMTTALKTVQAVVDSLDFGKIVKSLLQFSAIVGVITAVALPAFGLQLVGILKTFIAMAGPALVVSGTFLAMAGGIAALAIGIDLVVRNFNQLGNVLSTVVLAVRSGFYIVLEEISGALEKFFGQFTGFEVVSGAMKMARLEAKATADGFAKLGAKASETLDTGIAGNIWEQASKGLAAFKGETNSTTVALDNLSKVKGPSSGLLDSEKIKKAADAYKQLTDSVRKLSDIASLNAAELFANTQDITKGIDASEKQYQVMLKQIQLEKEKALLDGVSLSKVNAMTVKSLELAGIIRDQTQSLEIQKSVREAMLLAEKSAQDALSSLHGQRIQDNETLLRIGLTRNQIAARELQVELDKIDALQSQIEAAGKLDGFARTELDLARRTAVEKNKASNALQPGSAGAAPVIGDAATALGSVSSGPVGAIMAAAEGIVGAIQKLIDFIPNILNAIEKVFTSLAELPITILNAVKNVIKSLVTLIATFIPNLFKAIPEILDSLITALFETIPQAIAQLVEGLPALVSGLVAKIPELVTKFVEGFISSSITMVASLIDAIIQGTPEIIKSLIVLIPQVTKALIKGFMNGIVNAIKGIGKIFSSLFGGVGKGIQNAAKSFSTLITGGLKKLTGFKGNLFGLTDDTTSKTAEQGQALLNQITGAGKSGFEWLMKAWDAIKRGFQWVYDTLLAPVVNLITTAFSAVWNVMKVVFDVVINSFKALWNFVKTIFDVPIQLFRALWEFVKTIFDDPIKAFQNLFTDLKKIFTDIVDAFTTLGSKLWEGFKTAWNAGIDAIANIGGKMWESVKTAFSGIGNLFANIGTSAWKSFTDAFSGLGNWFGNIFKSIFKFDGGGTGTVEKFLGFDFPWMSFAEGGNVPGRAKVFGDSYSNDTVPALLSPGEAVIPRSLMNDPAVAKLVQGLLSGKGVGMHAGGFLGKIASGDFKGAVSDAGKTLSGVGSTIKGAVSSAGSFLGKINPINDVKELYNSIKQFIPSIDFSALLKDPLGYLMGQIKSNIKSLFQGPVMGSMKNAIGMAEGGSVPGYGTGDTTSAMLTPGEFVMKRSASESIGQNALREMNRTGQAPQKMGDVSVTMNIKTEQPIDEQFMRRVLIPAMKAELKSASLKGEFLMSDRGLRSTT